MLSKHQGTSVAGQEFNRRQQAVLQEREQHRRREEGYGNKSFQRINMDVHGPLGRK